MNKVIEKIDKLKFEIMSEVEDIRTVPINAAIKEAYPEIENKASTGNSSLDTYITRIRERCRFPIYCIVERIIPLKDAEERGNIYISGGIPEEYLIPKCPPLNEDGDTQTEEELKNDLDSEKKFFDIFNDKTQIKAIDSACSFLKELSKARASIELGNIETGTLKLMDTMRLLVELKPLLKKATEAMKGGLVKEGKTKLDHKKVHGYIQERIKARRTWIQATADAHGFFNQGLKFKQRITLSTIRHDYPMHSFN